MRQIFKPRFALFAVVFALLFSAGCTCDKNPSQSTPEKTIETYLRQSSLLKSVPDPLAYNGALGCFSEKILKWWHANVDNLAEDMDDLAGLPGPQKRALTFSYQVVSKGPQMRSGPPDIQKINQTKNKARYNVNGMEVNLVKEGQNWKFASLFGHQIN